MNEHWRIFYPGRQCESRVLEKEYSTEADAIKAASAFVRAGGGGAVVLKATHLIEIEPTPVKVTRVTRVSE